MSIKSSVLEKFRKRIAWDDINTQVLNSQLECARYEEIGNQKIDEADITSDACCVSGNGSAEIVVRENLTICGLHLIPHILKIFKTNTISHKLHYKEGNQVLKNSSSKFPRVNDILKLSKKKPCIFKINSHIRQKVVTKPRFKKI